MLYRFVQGVFLGGEEEAFGMFWWYKILEDEEQNRPNCCPNCGSKQVHYDEHNDICMCLDCNHEWRNNEF
jgi:hypothetical protein